MIYVCQLDYRRRHAYLQRFIVPDVPQVVRFTGRQQGSSLLQQHEASPQDRHHLQSKQTGLSHCVYFCKHLVTRQHSCTIEWHC